MVRLETWVPSPVLPPTVHETWVTLLSLPPLWLCSPVIIQMEVDITWLWGPPGGGNGSRRRTTEAPVLDLTLFSLASARTAAGIHTAS